MLSSFFSRIKKILIYILVLALCIVSVRAVVVALTFPPKSFPVPYSLSVEDGQGLFSISSELSREKAIRSPRVFEILMRVLGSDRAISKGQYYFERPIGVVELALRISGREFGVTKTRITIPEGFTNKQIGERLGKSLDNFDTQKFYELTQEKEGYLFPDTYIFFPWATAEIVVQTMERNFTLRTAPLEKQFLASRFSKEDIIVLASLIEKEANGDTDRALISGILWNRLEKGMLLQVDAPFLYLLGKESRELTRTDLAINSPYNTYRFKGLPPTPIANPGLASIEAALNPKKSPYLYYLHDEDGTMHYARSYQEHLQNIKKYLR